MAVARTATPAVKKAVAATKAPAKKAAPKSTGPLVFEAEFKKETSGAIHLVETGDRDTQVSGAIYLKKSVLNDVVPKKVRVTVEVIG